MASYRGLSSEPQWESHYESEGSSKFLGEVLVGIWHEGVTLHIRISKAKLPNKASAFAKVKLLSNVGDFEWRTKVKKSSCKPKFNETLKFRLKEENLFGTSVNLSIWDQNSLFGELYVGEFEVSLPFLNLKESKECWYSLQIVAEKSQATVSVGTIVVGLNYSPMDELLLVKVKRANISDQGVSMMHCWVSVVLPISLELPHSKNVTSSCISLLSIAEWNQEFRYESVSTESVSNSFALEISVWDKALTKSNKLMGSIRLGSKASLLESSLDLSDSEALHWTNMLSFPGQWVESCHELNPTKSYELDIVKSDILDPGLETKEAKFEEEFSTDVTNTEVTSFTDLEMDSKYIKGRLLLSLEYFNGNCYVKVMKAEDLAGTNETGFSDPYVKLCLLECGFKVTDWQSQVVKNTVNPIFDEEVQFALEESYFSSYELLFSVWSSDQDNKTQIFLGGFLVHLEAILVSGTYNGHFNLTDNFADVKQNL